MTGSPGRVELVVFVGLQASGKSTFFRERFAATHEHASKDLFRNNKNRNRRQVQLIETALSAGSPVVVDNTNPTVEERRTLIELGREHGVKIVGYYFESEVRRCIERNRRRVGKSRVPDVAIYATSKKLVPRLSPKASTSFSACRCPATLPSRSTRTPNAPPQRGSRTRVEYVTGKQSEKARAAAR